MFAQGTTFEGTWQLDKEGSGDFVEIKKTNDDYVFVRTAFNSTYQEIETERYPAFREGSSLSVRVGGRSIPALYEQDTDILTVDGRQTCRRIDVNIEDASVEWMTARRARIAENERLCEELKLEQDERKTDMRKDPDTWAAFKKEMKDRTPSGCLMIPLFF